MRSHVAVIAWLNIVWGGLYVVAGAFALLALVGIGSFAAAADGHSGLPALGVLGGLGVALGGFLGLIGLPRVLAGWGLLNRRSWARMLCIVLSVIDLWSFPVGTAIGVYSLVVLFDRDVVRDFG